MSDPRRTLASLALLLALGVAPVLTACGGTIDGSVGDNGAEIEIGGTDLPDDFPSTVPLIVGDIIGASSIGGDQNKVWNVRIAADDTSVLDDIEVDLKDAGFNVEAQISGDNGGTLVAEGSDYSVIAVVTEDADGIVANYTVTTKAG